jgi:hypothetical protein
VLELVTTVIEPGTSPYSILQDKEAALEKGRVVEPMTLRIRSPLLVNALKALITYYPGYTFDDTISLQAPYQLLVHYRAELEEYKSKQPACHPLEEVEEINKHIDCALRFLEENVGKTIDQERARHAQPIPAATFENYWMLLRPGDYVYSVQEGIVSPSIVKSVEGGVNGRPYQIKLWNISFDGLSFGLVTDEVCIFPFEGERAIASIPVYPINFHIDKPEKDKMWDRMIKRGKRFQQLTRQTYCDYNGHTLTHPRRKVRFVQMPQYGVSY